MNFSIRTLSKVLVLLTCAMPAVAQASISTTQPTDSLAADSVKELDEVVVMARRELIKSDGAKLTYDVEHDPLGRHKHRHGDVAKSPHGQR